MRSWIKCGEAAAAPVPETVSVGFLVFRSGWSFSVIDRSCFCGNVLAVLKWLLRWLLSIPSVTYVPVEGLVHYCNFDCHF
jgi:hypothetical protein